MKINTMMLAATMMLGAAQASAVSAPVRCGPVDGIYVNLAAPGCADAAEQLARLALAVNARIPANTQWGRVTDGGSYLRTAYDSGLTLAARRAADGSLMLLSIGQMEEGAPQVLVLFQGARAVLVSISRIDDVTEGETFSDDLSIAYAELHGAALELDEINAGAAR